ncbi:hypothetical protein D3C71_1855830 [compost metagenome]
MLTEQGIRFLGELPKFTPGATGKIEVRLSFFRGDLADKYAIDLGGSGKGRGAERVISSVKDGAVTIHVIVDYHK